MEFLEEILGTDLYEQVKTKVCSYNEKVDKDMKVSIVNVNNGEFIAKAKYDQLRHDLDNTTMSLDTANTTIADLKKNNKDNAELQAKIANYESEKSNLEAKHKATTERLIKESAIKDALYSQRAKHPDLLISKFDLSKILLDDKGENVISGIEEQMKLNKETYNDLFEAVEMQDKPYHYVPAGGSGDHIGGATDFVGIIKENQSRKI